MVRVERKETSINPENYLKVYEEWTEAAIGLWANKDRPEVASDIWWNRMRNSLALGMIGDLARGKKVLNVGTSPIWADRELLKGLGAAEVILNDIIDSGDIDLVADACDLPVEDQTYDLIVCREVIEHVLAPVKLLNELYRVLKDDGYLFIATPNAFNVRPEMIWHLRAYSPSYFLQALKKHNFKVVSKKGDVPGIFYALQIYAQQGDCKSVLAEFKKIAKMVDKMEDSYYIGTHLSVLCRKG